MLNDGRLLKVTTLYFQCQSPDSQETLWTLSSAQTDLRALFDAGRFFYVLSEEQFSSLSTLMDRCLSTDQLFGSDLRRNIVFMELLLSVSEILQHNVSRILPQPSREYAKLQPVIEYLNSHYTEDVSLDELSRSFFISKYYLCHQFKEMTGFTVGSYLLNYRVRQACLLLREGKSVQEAGETVGFKNNSHFIRRFGQIIGMSPGKYLRTQREERKENVL